MTTLLIVFGILLFLYGIIALGFKVYRNALLKRGAKSGAEYVVKLPLWAPATILGVVLFFLGLSIVVVPGQSVGVVYTPGGIDPVPLHSGWHLIAPWNKVYDMDKTVWVYTFTSKQTEGQIQGDDAIWAPTSEGIKMGFDMSVSWRIDPEYAPWIYQNVSEADGTDQGRYKWIEDNVIRAKTKSIFALTVSKFTPIECYSTGRVKIQELVFAQLKKELATYHIILDQIDIREVFYDPGFEAEIKNKKIQEQKYLTLLEVTKQKNEEYIQSKIDKDIQIQIAQGEAEALRIKGNSINANPKVIELNMIEKWNGVLPTTLITGGNNQSILLGVTK